MKRHQLLNILIAVCLLAISPLTVLGHTGSIELSGEQDYKQVLLPPQVENLANSDLSDLRLNDAQGETIPYFIYNVSSLKKEEQKTYILELVDKFTKDNQQFFDFTLEDLPSQDIRATSVYFATQNTDIVKQARLLGGYDGLVWEPVASATLYNVDGVSLLDIPFNQTEKYTYYRLILDNAENPISIYHGELSFQQTQIESLPFIQPVDIKYTVKQENNDTLISISPVRNLSLYQLELKTTGNFSREVILPNGSKQTIYNLDFQGETLQNTLLTLESYKPSQDTIVLRIKNYDDKPISIEDLSLTYLSHYLVFKGDQPAPYTLSFTGDSEETPPRYDIQTYQDKILTQGIDDLSLTDITVIPEEPPAEEKDYSMLFNVVTILLAVILGAVIIIALKKNKDNVNRNK